MLTDLWRRLRNTVAFATTTAPVQVVNGVATVQVMITPLEIMTLTIAEQRGFASGLKVGTPVVCLFANGERNNGCIVGSTAPTERPALAGEEDKAIYAHGYQITIAADGIHITGAPDVFITGNLHVDGNLLLKGGMTSGVGTNDQVTLQHHTHPGNGQPPTAGT
jgi:phage gp45-like